MTKTQRFAAFLGGINVGGNRKVPMADLKKAMEAAGYANVKTLLASGNIVFDSDDKPAQIEKDLEALLEKKFGFSVLVLVRSIEELAELLEENPFRKVKVTPETRLYITFTREKPEIKLPFSSDDKTFEILWLGKREVASVVTLKDGVGTIKGMDALRKMLGKDITTRNWNTVEKVVRS